MSRGNILRDSDVRDSAPGSTGQDTGVIPEGTRVISKVFTVTPEMSPITNVMVYYIRDDAEVVADSTEIKVKPQFENDVSSVIIRKFPFSLVNH